MAETTSSGEALENLARLVALDTAIARGLNDAESGQVKPSSEVFDRLETGLASKTGRALASPSPRESAKD